MNIIKSIELTYNYLCDIYIITKLDFVKAKEIKSENYIGHNIKSLIKHNLLIENIETSTHEGVIDNKTYKWNTAAPQFSLAYDYYNIVRGKKKTYEYLLNVLKTPENYKVNEILEAISIKGAQEQDMDIELKTDSMLIKTLTKTNENQITTLMVNKKNSDEVLVNVKTLELMIESVIDKKFKRFFNDYTMIYELMKEIADVTMENTDRTINNHNSISTIIAITKTEQENIFDISATCYHILKELYSQLSESLKLCPENRDIIQRKESISIALQFMRKRIDCNNAIINKYGNENSIRKT